MRDGSDMRCTRVAMKEWLAMDDVDPSEEYKPAIS